MILILSLSFSPGIWGTDFHHTRSKRRTRGGTDVDLKNLFCGIYKRKKKSRERDARGKIWYICSICIYTHAHIYIYTICVYRYMCTHIYICITTYSIRCFNTLVFEKTMEMEKSMRVNGHSRGDRRGGRLLFFWEGSPNYGIHWRTSRKKGPFWLLECLSSTPSFCYRCCFLLYAK